MLSNKPLCPTLPVVDLKRAMKFYEEKVGLNPSKKSADDFALYDTGKSQMYLYKREKTKAEHTAFTFIVEDIGKEVEELKQKGIEFMELDMPGIKTENGIADMGEAKSAWFYDSEGNIVAISQFT
jgi:predicted enzyme related to lactoylglutathione lyase